MVYPNVNIFAGRQAERLPCRMIAVAQGQSGHDIRANSNKCMLQQAIQYNEQ